MASFNAELWPHGAGRRAGDRATHLDSTAMSSEPGPGPPRPSSASASRDVASSRPSMLTSATTTSAVAR
jgi:hypothetical protein